MKPLDEMVQAIREWVKNLIKSLNDKAQAEMEKIRMEMDSDTILRTTGNASNVTTVFSKYGSRTLPASGEKLNVTLGKILKYLSDLKAVAFSGSYKDLSYRAIRLRARYSNYSSSAAYTAEILSAESEGGLEKMWLLVGTGGSESTANVQGATDFARVYLIVPKIEAGSTSNYKGRSFILLQLGSSGSTTRYTLTATAATGSHDEKITLTIPKGSYAHVAMYELNSSSNYVG